MNQDSDEKLDSIGISKKETYSAEEKQFIMDRLNEERLKHQRAEEGPTCKIDCYSEEDKKKILAKLNEKRLTKQKREEISQNRISNKKTYKFGSREFYKFKHMEREYYLEISDIKKISSRPAIISLYYRTFDEMNRKDVLIKTEIYSEKFYISYNAIRVYFKPYLLEDEK